MNSSDVTARAVTERLRASRYFEDDRPVLAHPAVVAIHNLASSIAIGGSGSKRDEIIAQSLHDAAQRLQDDLTFYLPFVGMKPDGSPRDA